MTDPFDDVPEPSEALLSDHLFPFFDGLAEEFGLNSDEITSDLQRVLRPSVLDEYRVWIFESWESVEDLAAVPLSVHGPIPQPALFRPRADGSQA